MNSRGLRVYSAIGFTAEANSFNLAQDWVELLDVWERECRHGILALHFMLGKQDVDTYNLYQTFD
jgi:hypothetical protein